MEEKEEDIKESFCPVCIAAIPLAFSLSTGVAAASEEEQIKQRNAIILWSSVVGVISLAVIIYYLFIRKCDSCE